MKWSIGLGRIFGIRFRVHLTFLFLVGLFGLVGVAAGGPRAGISSMLFICLVFVCVTLHELAHSLVALSVGIPVDSITLLPIGGVAAMRGMPESPLQEILISVAGPVTSISIFTVMTIFLQPELHQVWPPDPFTTDPRAFLVSLAAVNLVLGLFNLIPAFPMDGGRMLRGLLALVMGFVPATRVATFIGQAFAMVLIAGGLFFFGNLWLMLIGFFIYMGASAEKRNIRIRAVLRQVQVGQVMLTGFHVLDSQEPVSAATADLMHGFQEDFPVVGDGQFLGIVPAHVIVKAMRARQLERPGTELMSVDLPAVTPETSLDAAHQKMIFGKHTVLPVTSGGHLVGIISQNQISRFLTMHRNTG